MILKVGRIAARWLQVLEEESYLVLGRCQLGLLLLFRFDCPLKLLCKKLILALQAPQLSLDHIFVARRKHGFVPN